MAIRIMEWVNIAMLAALLLLFAATADCQAQDSIILGWEPSASEPLDLGEGGGYRIYCDKQSLLDTSPQQTDEALKRCETANTYCTIDTSGWRGRNYCAASAWYIEKSEEFESDWSNQISEPFRPHPPGMLQKITQAAAAPAKKIVDAVAGFFGKKKTLKVESYEWN